MRKYQSIDCFRDSITDSKLSYTFKESISPGLLKSYSKFGHYLDFSPFFLTIISSEQQILLIVSISARIMLSRLLFSIRTSFLVFFSYDSSYWIYLSFFFFILSNYYLPFLSSSFRSLTWFLSFQTSSTSPFAAFILCSSPSVFILFKAAFFLWSSSSKFYIVSFSRIFSDLNYLFPSFRSLRDSCILTSLVWSFLSLSLFSEFVLFVDSRSCSNIFSFSFRLFISYFFLCKSSFKELYYFSR